MGRSLSKLLRLQIRYRRTVKWGRRLATARRRVGMSQRRLAEVAGVPQSTVGRIEAGLVEPRIETMDRLLRSCGDMLDNVARLGEGVDMTQIRGNLARSPDERLADNVGFAKFARAARDKISRARAPFDPMRLLRTLVDAEVGFIVVGTVAAGLHGSSQVTDEMEICYAGTVQTTERLVVALRALGSTVLHPSGRSYRRIDTKTISMSERFVFDTDAGRLECREKPLGSCGFEGLLPSAVEFPLGGLLILAASLDDLIRMKRAGGRPQDLSELEGLGALREELRE